MLGRISPIPEDQRTDKRLYQFFFVWFSANANILTYVEPTLWLMHPSRMLTKPMSVFRLSAGTVGPAYYSLGIRDSFYVILVVDLM